MSLLNPSIKRAITHQPSFEGRLSLIDNTKTKSATELDDGNSETPATEEGEEVGAVPGSSLEGGGGGGGTLSRAGTHFSARAGRDRLKENLARRKYARYQKDRYIDSEDEGGADEAESGVGAEDGDGDEENDREGGTSISRLGTSSNISRAVTGTTLASDTVDRLRRGKAKVKHKLRGKPGKTKIEGETATDVLWENQRGFFFFGRAYYSSNSLLNFDLAPWTNMWQQESPVDITDAQCPDPTWEWAWQTWYVDMSLDVDESGWQYSFMFQQRFDWHGTHPWYHSWVRRRRWIRKRIRKNWHGAVNTSGVAADWKEGVYTHGMKEAHRLNPDYFTIHPAARQTADDATSYTASMSMGGLLKSTVTDTGVSEEQDDAGLGVDNIPTLWKRLKAATMDREKINLVMQFIDESGLDLCYLADEIPHIMSMMMYQYSRRQLVSGMAKKLDAMEAEPEEGAEARAEARGKANTDHEGKVDTDREGKANTDHENKPQTQSKTDSPNEEPSSSSNPRSPPQITLTQPTSQPTTNEDVDLDLDPQTGSPSIKKSRTRALRSAISAADSNLPHWEYWSDIRNVIHKGQSMSGADEEYGWKRREWAGIDDSGPGAVIGSGSEDGPGSGPGAGAVIGSGPGAGGQVGEASVHSRPESQVKEASTITHSEPENERDGESEVD